MEEGDDIDAQLAAQEMAARNAITQLFKQRALQAKRKQTKMVQVGAALLSSPKAACQHAGRGELLAAGE